MQTPAGKKFRDSVKPGELQVLNETLVTHPDVPIDIKTMVREAGNLADHAAANAAMASARGLTRGFSYAVPGDKLVTRRARGRHRGGDLQYLPDTDEFKPIVDPDLVKSAVSYSRSNKN